jgi:hypothetical protein
MWRVRGPAYRGLAASSMANGTGLPVSDVAIIAWSASSASSSVVVWEINVPSYRDEFNTAAAPLIRLRGRSTMFWKR